MRKRICSRFWGEALLRLWGAKGLLGGRCSIQVELRTHRFWFLKLLGQREYNKTHRPKTNLMQQNGPIKHAGFYPPSQLTRLGGWRLYMLIMLIFNLLIWAGPVLLIANPNIANPYYAAFGFTCHQLDSRSLCIFPAQGLLAVGDCTPQYSTLVTGRNDLVYSSRGVGLKLPVCARDIGIYGGMLLGGVFWMLKKRKDPGAWPSIIWLLLAMIPTAIDGFTQLFGMRESTNALRLWTGLILGVAMAYFIIPIAFQFFDEPAIEKKKANLPSFW